jgi:hypothetical protein
VWDDALAALSGRIHVYAKLNRRAFLKSTSLATPGAVIARTENAIGSSVAPHESQNFEKVQIKVVPVRDGVYMVQGEGGNIRASVGEDGIAVVDDEYAPLAGRIRAALNAITGKEQQVRFVINAHHHGDHMDGNANFGRSAVILGAVECMQAPGARGPVGNGGSLYQEVKPSSRVALPLITFTHDVKIHLNGENMRALHCPAATRMGTPPSITRKLLSSTRGMISSATDFRSSTSTAAVAYMG